MCLSSVHSSQHLVEAIMQCKIFISLIWCTLVFFDSAIAVGNNTLCNSGQHIIQIQGRPGRDGRDGLPGTTGREGQKGEKGSTIGLPGPRGPAGLQGPKGDSGLRGRQGITGPRGPQGFPGIHGQKGDRGVRGYTGPPGATRGGMTYTRWGKSSCPHGTSLVYAGRTAGAGYSSKGSGSNYICLSNSPQFLRYTPGRQGGRGHLYGTQYQTGTHSADTGPLSGVSQHNAPCAVCYSATKEVSIMIPGQTSCPSSWTREYYGYLMSEHHNHHVSTYECIDWNPDTVPGEGGNQDDAYLYHVEIECHNGVACPPYISGREITCVVCSK